ncbi:glycosyltransferase family 4 protein [Niallia sp. HCP3S3_B10]|uniref:glycosyltransferase family 4 protein n=1 Tax=Niallia sp. HCP3S3_B10 TaxID=3438944 RepID=UPI003F8AA1DE
MKRICFLLGDISGSGGIPRVVSLIANKLSGNFDISIVSYYNQNNLYKKLNKNVKQHVLLDSRLDMKKGLLSGTFKLRKIMKKNKFDVIIACGALFFPMGVLATRMNKTKLICWEHSNFYVTTDNSFQRFTRKVGARFSDLVLTLTKKDMENYKENLVLNNIDYIYNPIDQYLQRDELNYNINSKKIISVGRLTYQKNFIDAVEVASEVLKKYPGWEWHIYGDGELKERISNEVKKHELQNKLILMGQSDNLYSKYPDYSILVMTSLYEGFPMTLLEGLANKLPLVSYDILTGPSEIIINNENGYLIEPGNKNMMVEKVSNLIEDIELRKSMSKATSNLTDKFNITNITDKWVKILEDI